MMRRVPGPFTAVGRCAVAGTSCNSFSAVTASAVCFSIFRLAGLPRICPRSTKVCGGAVAVLCRLRYGCLAGGIALLFGVAVAEVTGLSTTAPPPVYLLFRQCRLSGFTVRFRSAASSVGHEVRQLRGGIPLCVSQALL